MGCYIAGFNASPVAEFVEVESGKRDDRTELARALAECPMRKGRGFEQPVPSRRVLPEETRRAVTDMLAQLPLDHGRVDRCPIRTEAVDDV